MRLPIGQLIKEYIYIVYDKIVVPDYSVKTLVKNIKYEKLVSI